MTAMIITILVAAALFLFVAAMTRTHRIYDDPKVRARGERSPFADELARSAEERARTDRARREADTAKLRPAGNPPRHVFPSSPGRGMPTLNLLPLLLLPLLGGCASPEIPHAQVVALAGIVMFVVEQILAQVESPRANSTYQLVRDAIRAVAEALAKPPAGPAAVAVLAMVLGACATPLQVARVEREVRRVRAEQVDAYLRAGQVAEARAVVLTSGCLAGGKQLCDELCAMGRDQSISSEAAALAAAGCQAVAK